MNKLGIIVSTSCLALVFSMSSWATNFSYSNLDLQAERFYLKDSLSQDGGSIASLTVGYQFQPNFFGRFNLKRYSYDQTTADLSLLQVGLGLGLAFPISNTADVFALVEAGEINLSSCSSLGLTKCHDTYIKSELGIRHWATSNIELNIAHHYYHDIKLYKKAGLSDSSFEIPVGISFWLDPRAALKLGYTYAENAHRVSAGYEYRF